MFEFVFCVFCGVMVGVFLVVSFYDLFGLNVNVN